MVVLADNDALLKLGCCDLLDEFFDAFDTSGSETYVLPRAKRVLASKLERSSQLDEYLTSGLQRTLEFLDAVSILSEAEYISTKYHSLLLAEEGIHIGEALLFAAAATIQNSVMLTGDKKAIKALASAEPCREIVERLDRRVICFERCMLEYIELLSFETIRSRVVPARHCDGVLRDMAFNQGYSTSDNHARAALHSNIRDLRASVGSLLYE